MHRIINQDDWCPEIHLPSDLCDIGYNNILHSYISTIWNCIIYLAVIRFEGKSVKCNSFFIVPISVSSVFSTDHHVIIFGVRIMCSLMYRKFIYE